MQAIRKVGSRVCRGYVLVFPLLLSGLVDQTARRTLALDPGDARSHSIGDLTAPEIPDNDRGLIQGEAGTGKTLVAKATHDLAGRSGKPFRRVSCLSLPAELLEAEIFSPGGKLGLTAGGTLLLDEVDELPAAPQSGVARALNDGRFFSLEWPARRAANVRILATTTRPRSALSTLSEDLHHLEVPPRRERREEFGGSCLATTLYGTSTGAVRAHDRGPLPETAGPRPGDGALA